MQKYQSIERVGSKYYEETKNKLKWKPLVVTEKIHGANFSFQFEEGQFKVCSRKRELDLNENFYDFQVVVEKYKDNIEKLYNYIGKDIAIYGELFGGNSYNGIKSKYTQIQKGVFYTPDIEFMVFDIKVDGYYLSHNEVLSLCNEFGLKHVPIVADNITIDNLSQLNTEFDSIVAKLFGYNIENNTCEGVVVKPKDNIYDDHKNRIIYKIVNDSFKQNKSRRKRKEKSLIDTSFLNAILTDEYWDKFKGKGYNLDINQFSYLVKEMLDDVYRDIDIENYPKEIKKEVNKQVSNFLRKRLLKGQ